MISQSETSTAVAFESRATIALGTIDETSWKDGVYLRLEDLQQGKVVPGVGDFRLSQRAAVALRRFLNQVDPNLAPAPAITPISGQGAILLWTIGTRSIEVTAFADGEIVVEARQDDVEFENLADQNTDSLVAWLMSPSHSSEIHVPA